MKPMMMFAPNQKTDRLSATGTQQQGGTPPSDNGRNAGADVATKTKVHVKKPSLYRVLLLNDDYTPMDFVVYILKRFFQKSHQKATEIMLQVHHSGMGECGIYTYEVAEAKAAQVMDCARHNEHPLQCIIEKE